MKAEDSKMIVVAKVALFVFTLCLIIWPLVQFSSATALTPRESTLFAVFLTAASLFLGWLITHVYSAQQTKATIDDVVERSQESLRMYALKASEKVNNLSTQLASLALYLQVEVDDTSSDTDHRLTLLAREERIYSAIAMIRMLKAQNDTSLSDWEGVIGEELEEQREERTETEETIKRLVDRVESLSTTDTSSSILFTEVESMRRELRSALTALGGATPLPPKIVRTSVRKQKVECKCPECSSAISFQQRPKAGSTKVFPCPNCGAKLITRWNEANGFSVEKCIPIAAQIICPACAHVSQVAIEPQAGAGAAFVCECQKSLRVSRLTNGTFRVRVVEPVVVPNDAKLDDRMIESVKNLMPEQPWPSGAAKQAAEKLGISNALVARAISELIRRGVFLHQVEGKLFKPVETLPPSVEPSIPS